MSEKREVVLVEVHDGVGVVTMNRPDARNALNEALRSAVVDELSRLDVDPAVRAIVLTGSDPAFCAGLDLKEISSRPREESAAFVSSSRGPFPELTTPLIGAINGAAVTGGFEYALACDFLIASERARFADTHARVGIMPGWGLTVLLPRAVGVRRARQMSFTGNYIDAATALQWGLVNEVVAHGELISRALQLGRDIASIDAHAVATIRETYRQVTDTTVSEAWGIESSRSSDWMRDFDPDALAANRQAIQDRGRGQVGS